MKKIDIDARELRCPLPLLKLKQALFAAEVGDEITLITRDTGSKKDIPSFIALTNHVIMAQTDNNDEIIFVVQKGEPFENL